MKEENMDSEIAIDAYWKRQFRQIFCPPDNQDWCIDASFPDGYFFAGKAIAEGVVSGNLREGTEGVAALFLFRHYLELRLKLIIFHGRWMRDWEKNAADNEIQAVRKSHSLNDLWDEAQRECRSRIPKEVWDSFDLDFVDKCVKEFHALDPNGECFRYPTPRIQVVRTQHLKYPMRISFDALLGVMEHVHSVLEWIDGYLIERHGENEEWEQIQNSY